MQKSKKFSLSKTSNKAFKKKRLYDNPEWANYSRRFLATNRECYSCGVKSEILDHVLAHKGDEVKFWNITNMIPLCKKCHDFITATFDRHPVPKTEEKMKWISAKRAETETYVKVKMVTREIL